MQEIFTAKRCIADSINILAKEAYNGTPPANVLAQLDSINSRLNEAFAETLFCVTIPGINVNGKEVDWKVFTLAHDLNHADQKACEFMGQLHYPEIETGRAAFFKSTGVEKLAGEDCQLHVSYLCV